MKKASEQKKLAADMREEYDFNGAVRGKYAAHYAEGTNLILLDPDVAEVFPNAESVNQALRALADIARRQKARRPSRKAAKP